MLLNNLSPVIFLPVQLGNSPVFLSVVGICQLASGHTFENLHYMLIISHLINMPLPKVESRTLTSPDAFTAWLWHVTFIGQSRCAHTRRWATWRGHYLLGNLLWYGISLHDGQGQSFWRLLLNVMGAELWWQQLPWVAVTLRDSFCGSLLDFSTSYPAIHKFFFAWTNQSGFQLELITLTNFIFLMAVVFSRDILNAIPTFVSSPE